MTGKRFLNFLAHRGIPASCLAQRIGCHLSAIKNLAQYERVPKHYIRIIIREFGMYLNGDDLKRLTGV